MSRPVLATLAAVCVLSVPPSDALAAPITATQLASFSLTDTLDTVGGVDTTLQFDQFDAALGTLTEVVLSIGDPVTHETLVLHAVGSPARVENAALMLTVIGIPQVPPFPFPAPASCSSCGVGSTDLVFSAFGSVTATYPVASQPNLGVPFIGSGILALMLSAEVAGTAQNATVTGTWIGDARIHYTYEPAPATVPEPASLMLLGAGLSAIGWRRRGGQA